jgi:AmmeMemoRadiSam system protein A
MDTYIRLAKNTVETYVKTGIILKPPVNLPKELLTKRAGVFVSIHAKSGKLRGLPRRHALATRGRRPREQVSVLRGCIGTFLPTKPSLAQEIIANAISSAAADPRFPPVSEKELPELVYSVDVLSEPKPANKKKLDPKKYGLIVSTSDGRRGLLLPDIPGVETPEEQFRICCWKAGIHPSEKVRLQTFTVERYHSD